ncbi:MAG: TfoX/Sxy family protein [Myxococcota bacterium]
MPYEETVAARVRELMQDEPDWLEKKMFGGLCFMVAGHMCCGIVGEELMVRVGPEGHADALAQKHARPMDFTGRPLKGMVYVATPGFATKPALRKWVSRGLTFVRSLPPKR